MTIAIRSARAPGRARSLLPALLALSVLALGACRDGDAADAADADAPVLVGPENIAVVRTGEIQSGPSLSGSLRPAEEATVRAELSGPVLGTYVEPGQAVARGQLLVRLDDTAPRENVLSAQSALRSAQLTLENARRDLERSQRLVEAGAVAERELEGARRGVLAAEAGYADARARLTLAQEQLSKAQIRAPISGVVSARPVNAGDVVQPGTPLVTVVDPSSMRLEASIPAERVDEIAVGAPVQFAVAGYPGRTFTGRISRVNPTADPATRQVQLLVDIPNAGRSLVAGLFAEGRVATESRRGLLVPETAVDQEGSVPTVTVVRGGRVQRAPVELGLVDRQAEQVEIRTGVNPGDTLLLGAVRGLTSGARITVTAPGADRPADAPLVRPAGSR